jgi:glycosyltransferase involved in cell wall biosynthesis
MSTQFIIKNIAIVIDGLTGGGAEKVMLTLAEHFAKSGHRVSILSLSSFCDYPLPDNISVDYLFEGKASKVDRFWLITKSIKKLTSWFDKIQKVNQPFDLVLSNLDRSNNLLASSNIDNVFYVIHNSIEEELNRQKKLGPLAYWYLKKSKRKLCGKNLICVSKGIEKEIQTGHLINPQSIQTIYNPFDLAAIQQQADIANDGIPLQPYIIHVGRLAKQKRHDILFEAFKSVDKKYALVLLCNNPKKALKLARKYGIEHRLILPGFQTNPYNWIKQAKALVLNSDYEGFGNVLIEALSVGTIAVSTDCPHGPDEILTGNLAQFLVPRREPEKLAQTINKAIEYSFNSAQLTLLDEVAVENITQKYLALINT